MSKNGRYRLDLSDLVEPIELKIGEYECVIRGDMSLTAMGRLSKAFAGFDDVENIDLEQLGISEDEMWALCDEVLSMATPSAPSSAKELLTTAAAIKLLNFLAGRFTEKLQETSSTK